MKRRNFVSAIASLLTYGAAKKIFGETLEDETLSKDAFEKSGREPVILVDKANRTLYLLNNKKIIKTYPIDMGFNPEKDKLMEGDGCTPEGRYFVSVKKGVGQSDFYKAYLINYPSETDWKEFRKAKTSGIIPENAEIGGDIEIHGYGRKGFDWTLGCIAVDNSAMDYMDNYVKAGTPVIIVKKSSMTSI